MTNIVRRVTFAVIIFSFLFAFATPFFAAKNKYDIIGTNVISLSENLYAKDADGNRVPVSTIFDTGDKFVIYLELPTDESSGDSVTISSLQNHMRVFLDDEIIYEIDPPKLGNTLNLVKLPKNFGGKELRIEVDWASFPYTDVIPLVSFGTEGDLLMSHMRSNLVPYSFGVLFFSCAVILSFVVIMAKSRRLNIYVGNIVCLILFLLSLSFWVVTDCRLLPILGGASLVNYYVSYISVISMPISCLMFFSEIATHGKKVFSAMAAFFAITDVTLIVLNFTSAATLDRTLFIVHAGIIVSCIVSLCIFTYAAIVTRRSRTKLILAGTSSLVAGGVLSMVMYYLFSGARHSIVFFYIGILVFLFIWLYDMLRVELKYVKEGFKAEFYHDMAYMDALTGIANRAALERHISAIEENPDCNTVSAVFFDINGLKSVNDKFGHSDGDELIKCSAHLIRDCFEKYGRCFRYGGDEFVALMKDIPAQTLYRCMDEFKTGMKSCDSVNKGIEVSISVGYATVRAESPDFMKRLIEEADAMMYKNKRAYREKSE